MSELQDIFREYGAEYRRRNKVSLPALKVMSAIENCRTGKLGAHAEVCEDCGNVQVSYNSCRNRHCPKCQSLPRERWVQARTDDLLDIPYFHAVFTIPAALRPVVFQNQRALYSLLFRCASETILELAADEKYLHAKTGLTAILHTWGQNLTFHPHIHCSSPGGGLVDLGKWRSSGKKFFLPGRVMSKLFRGKFLAHIQTMKLEFHGTQKHLENPAGFQRLLQSCYKQNWVVYCKPPFGSAARVVQYLGRYTHRVAISNHRILSVQNGLVTFRYKDYKDAQKHKTMTLTANEFIRRFLLHVLPHRFTKIRHYGILASRGKKLRLRLCKQFTGTRIRLRPKLSTAELILQTTGLDITCCAVCGSKNLRPVAFPMNTS